MESTEVPCPDEADGDDGLSDVSVTPSKSKAHSGSDAGPFGDRGTGNGDASVTNQIADCSPGGGKDSDNNLHSFVTLSPPTSPSKPCSHCLCMLMHDHICYQH